MADIFYSALINSKNQLTAALEFDIAKIYIPYDLFYSNELTDDFITSVHKRHNAKVYIALPQIMRERDTSYIARLKGFLLLGKADGVLVRNLEQIGLLYSWEEDFTMQYISINGMVEGFTPLILEADYTIYNYNKSSLLFVHDYCKEASAPLELSIHEIKELDDRNLSISIYGKAPLMTSANCIKRTCGECINAKSFGFDRKLLDRKNVSQLVYINCIHCFNILYNNVATSYHKQMHELIIAGFVYFRLDFTDETVEEINSVLSYYINERRTGVFPIIEYTTGHIGKGVK